MTNREYSRDLLRRINALIIEGVPIHTYFHKYYDGKGHSFWASQQFHLYQEVKVFSESKEFKRYLETKPQVKFSRQLIDYVFHAIAFVSTQLAVHINLKNRNILTYSVDVLKQNTKHDPRLIEVYKALEEEKILYQEIHHTLFGKKFLKNFLKRKRASMYLQSLHVLFKLRHDRTKKNAYLMSVGKVDLVEFADHEKDFVKHILEVFAIKCLESEFRIEYLEKVLKTSSIKMFISIDDARYGNELIIATHLAGIESHIFQHSNFDYFYGLDTLPPGMYAFPDYFYVWGDYWLNRIPELSPLFAFYKEHLKIGGRANGYKPGPSLHKDKKSKEITVLVPYESNINKSDFLEFIKKLMECEAVKIVFKGRPDMELKEQVRDYGIEDFVREGKVSAYIQLSDEQIRDIDVIVGVYTTLIDEYIQQSKPALVFRTDYPVFNDLVKGGVADGVIISDDICKALRLSAVLSPAEVERRREFLSAGDVATKEIIKELIKTF